MEEATGVKLFFLQGDPSGQLQPPVELGLIWEVQAAGGPLL